MAAAVSNRRSSTSKEFHCSICGRTFDSVETLDSHKRIEHSQRNNISEINCLRLSSSEQKWYEIYL